MRQLPEPVPQEMAQVLPAGEASWLWSTSRARCCPAALAYFRDRGGAPIPLWSASPTGWLLCISAIGISLSPCPAVVVTCLNRAAWIPVIKNAYKGGAAALSPQHLHPFAFRPWPQSNAQCLHKVLNKQTELGVWHQPGSQCSGPGSPLVQPEEGQGGAACAHKCSVLYSWHRQLCIC